MLKQYMSTVLFSIASISMISSLQCMKKSIQSKPEIVELVKAPKRERPAADHEYSKSLPQRAASLAIFHFSQYRNSESYSCFNEGDKSDQTLLCVTKTTDPQNGTVTYKAEDERTEEVRFSAEEAETLFKTLAEKYPNKAVIEAVLCSTPTKK